MKTLLSILLLCAATAQAQYRYNSYDSGIATNASIATNGNASHLAVFAVAAGTKVDIQMAFKLTKDGTNEIPTSATNAWLTTWDSSMDGARWTNRFQYQLLGVATNTEVWGTTNFAVTLPWLRLINSSNFNLAVVTNHSVKIGQKVGL